MTRHEILPGRSEIHVEGSSSIHAIHGRADGTTGFIALDSDGRLVAARVEVFAERLSWGNPLLDRETRRRIDTVSHPAIVGELTDVESVGAAHAQRFHARGTIAFHGTTRDVEGDLVIAVPTPGTLVVEGNQTFDVRDWDLEPPRLFALKVSPEIRVWIRIEAVATQ